MKGSPLDEGFSISERKHEKINPLHYGQATPERERCRAIGVLYYPVYLPHQAKVISWVQNPFCYDFASKIAFTFALVWLDH